MFMPSRNTKKIFMLFSSAYQPLHVFFTTDKEKLNKWSKNSDDRPHNREDFSLGKFNVTLNCQSERWLTPCGEILTSGALGIVTDGVWETSTSSPSKVPLPLGISSFGISKSKSQMASRSVQPFS